MGNLSSLFNNLIAIQKTKRVINNVNICNEINKNITRYELSDIEGFIERDQLIGSYVISGGNLLNRTKTEVSIAVCSIYKNIPVIVLHEGNGNLQYQLYKAANFINNKVFIDKNNSLYDPFYNRTSQEIGNMIMNASNLLYRIDPIGINYINGIYELIQGRKTKPFCDMFIRCPHDTLFDIVNDEEKRGYISSFKATTIRNMLMQGQSERAKIQAFFSQLSMQGRGILSEKNNCAYSSNVKAIIETNGLISIDIGSGTNDIILSLILSEIKEILSKGKQLMLIIDDINVNSCDEMKKILNQISSKNHITISAEDVYSMLGADDNIFSTITGYVNKCIVFSHSVGTSCNKWSEVFGYYDNNKISKNVGINQNYQWGYGVGLSENISIETNREPIVKPEELMRMKENEVYILDRNLKELAFTTIR